MVDSAKEMKVRPVFELQCKGDRAAQEMELHPVFELDDVVGWYTG